MSLLHATELKIKAKVLVMLMVVVWAPLVCREMGLGVFVAAGIGVLLAAGVFWYVVRRLSGAVSRLRKLTDQLDDGAPKKVPFNDELSSLVHSYDRFVSALEASMNEAPKALLSDTSTAMEAVAPVKSHFKTLLATGDPVVGKAIVLPRRVDEDLAALAELSGQKALAFFRESIDESMQQLSELHNTAEIGQDQKGIIDFQILLLQDSSLINGVEQCLKDGLTLPESLNTTFALIVGKLESSKNAYLKARATDFFDLRQRLMDNVFRRISPNVNEFYLNAKEKIVFCENIFPTDVVSLYRAGAKGIVSVQGTASSHAEILLGSFNMPSLTNVDGLPIQFVMGREVLLDTVNKTLIIDPTPEEIENLSQPTAIDHDNVIKSVVRLASGERMRVLATINNVTIESRRALNAGADGVGLFRSEMSYIGRPDLPAEEELFQEYRVLTDTFPDQPVAMRMLDLGSDKLAMFQQDGEREENPCMGNRSMRLLIRRPDVFRTQLRAMLRATSMNTCILFPMISGWYELYKVRAMIDKTVAELERDGVTHIKDVRYGIMVEIPGIVERFGDYVTEFDEFNIGSNDLTQYALAADRNNRNVADYFSFYHPSVLSMISKVCRLGEENGKVVRLCGEMGSDVEMLPLLVGLGVRQISTHYYLIPRIKLALKRLDGGACRNLAAAAFECRSAEEVKAEVEKFHQANPMLLESV